MGRRTPCFFLEPGNTAEETYRRFVWTTEGVCPLPGKYHNAIMVIGTSSWQESYHGCGDIPSDEVRADLRWPTACACGYTFKPEDQWQHGFHRHFVDAPTQRKFTLSAAPPGAMWNADWMGKEHRGPDGIALCVRLPDGVDWLVDGPSRSPGGAHGPGWTRTGTLPNVTATPSILTDGYHGFLTNGELVEC